MYSLNKNYSLPLRVVTTHHWSLKLDEVYIEKGHPSISTLSYVCIRLLLYAGAHLLPCAHAYIVERANAQILIS